REVRDQLAARLLVDPEVEQLHLDQRHVLSFRACRRGAGAAAVTLSSRFRHRDVDLLALRSQREEARGGPRRGRVRSGQAPGLPPTPQCFAGTPCTITWMCSGAAPLDSASAFVRLSMILGTDSSVTRVSYSFTSIQGMSGLLPPSGQQRDDSDRGRELQGSGNAALAVPRL